MASEIVERQLSGMGVSGAIISVLMAVIVLLAGVIGIMYRQANKVYGYRLAERDTLMGALNDSKTAMREMIEATKDRNEVTEQLSDLISKQTSAFATLELTVNNHYTNLMQQQQRLELVVSSTADALRVLTGIMRDVRSQVTSVGSDLKLALSTSFSSFSTEMRGLVTSAIEGLRKRPRT
jgi:hypothetical protein